MEQKQGRTNAEIAEFCEIVKKAYDRGLKESDLTLEKLMEELEADLKNLVID